MVSMLRPRVATLRCDRPTAVQSARLGSSKWRRLRIETLRRDAGLCVQCMTTGRIRPAREVDHIVPLADGGSNDLCNLQSLCVPCHREKSAREAAAAPGGQSPHPPTSGRT